MGGCDAGGGRGLSQVSMEGSGALEATLSIHCLLVCKCIHDFQGFNVHSLPRKSQVRAYVLSNFFNLFFFSTISHHL